MEIRSAEEYQFVMDAYGNLHKEHASDEYGRAIAFGPQYVRSCPLNSIRLMVPPESRTTWFTTDHLSSGHLKLNPHEEDRVIQISQAKGPCFLAHSLMKVNNEIEGDKQCLPRDEFYPVMHRMLRNKISWGSNFKFFRQANFLSFVLEWTESILSDFGDVFRQADIYGAVAISRYSYDFCPNVWRAFCELWGPLSNTFHHGNGEMGISLYDLKVIGGLPILGLPYDEFIPLNRELCREDLYPSTIGELLKIHAQLCVFHKKGQVFHDQWIEHFFRGEAIYGAAGNKNNIVPEHKAKDLKFPLNISREGQLAAFLAFWLSRFVLPLDNAIRLECFYMASLMVRGFRVSLAPAVLGLIYHALGTVATHCRGPGLANAYLPIHYVMGWLGEHFPDLIDRRSDNDFPAHYPLLARSGFMVYRPSVFLAQEDCILLDTESLADNAFEFLVCMRSALLPVRLGGDLWLEPYYPNRFAHQFGFDQGVPENKLLFSVCERQRCEIEKLARAQAVLLRKDTTTRFYIPRFTHIGECSWSYCRWWMTACAPYMGFSVSKIFSVVDRGHKKRIPNAKGEHFSGVNHVMHQSQRINRDSHHKQARHADHNKVEDGSSSHVLDEESSNPVQGK
ncbi:uncharacterized protein LOC109946775 [Prunus persica]|uniref:uncharacterized protein LOC109946775 n=1 Tax=Prunus persica TaxID=3760 RepID=UPI0009AB7175|nr:uncharacterized protein LOC109946775 [Prunus persica]